MAPAIAYTRREKVPLARLDTLWNEITQSDDRVI